MSDIVDRIKAMIETSECVDIPEDAHDCGLTVADARRALAEIARLRTEVERWKATERKAFYEYLNESARLRAEVEQRVREIEGCYEIQKKLRAEVEMYGRMEDDLRGQIRTAMDALRIAAEEVEVRGRALEAWRVSHRDRCNLSEDERHAAHERIEEWLAEAEKRAEADP